MEQASFSKMKNMLKKIQEDKRLQVFFFNYALI